MSYFILTAFLAQADPISSFWHLGLGFGAVVVSATMSFLVLMALKDAITKMDGAKAMAAAVDRNTTEGTVHHQKEIEILTSIAQTLTDLRASNLRAEESHNQLAHEMAILGANQNSITQSQTGFLNRMLDVIKEQVKEQ